MPFFANTPESLIGRSDSKDPSTTCRGITSSGRPCRRPIAAASKPPPRSKAGGLRVDDPQDETLYCWQHKEQASLSARSSPGPKTSTTPILEERTSLDTLADRLGIVAQEKSKQQRHGGRSSTGHGGGKAQRHAKMARPKTKKTVEFCCCFRIPIEEVPPPPRPVARPLQQQPSASAPVTPTYGGSGGGRKTSGQHYLAPPSPSPSRPRPSLPGAHSSPSAGRNSRRHSSTGSQASQTATFLSLIPPSTSPQTASLLMAELAKPISQLDEPGYIYVFWLTPESQPSAPPAEAARSLLTPTKRPSGQRRPSDVLESFAADNSSRRASGAKSSKKVLLKIGRATNVQRRLNEWTRQCGYNLSLIRYYPYIPSGGSPASGGDGMAGQPRKMPHSHRVERLVHLELAGRGLRVADREKCEACGREHREWFEVEATRAAVADVDEVVRRWVEWDERMT